LGRALFKDLGKATEGENTHENLRGGGGDIGGFFNAQVSGGVESKEKATPFLGEG